MKKLIMIFLSILMLFSFLGCQNGETESPVPSEELYSESSFIGTWINENDVLDSIVLCENGRGNYYEQIDEYSSSKGDINWYYSDGFIIIELTNDYKFEIHEENGQLYMTEIKSEYFSSLYDGVTKFKFRGNDIITAKIGETVKTDSAEIIINNLTFTEVASTDNLEPSTTGIVPANDDMLYACFEFKVTSLCKEEKNLEDICIISLDYNNGFIFGENMAGHYALKDSTKGYRTYSGNGSSSGQALYLSPLTSEEYRGCIECPVMVSEDETSPLKFLIKLFSETNGYENVEIIVK